MYKINIKIQKGFEEEKNYALSILSEFSGIEFDIEFTENEEQVFILQNGKKISFNDGFFSKARDRNTYLSAELLPAVPSRIYSPAIDGMPVIYGNNIFEIDENGCQCGLDIVASAFFMLSRWEEVVVKERDDHGRFPGHLSLAFRNGFLNRPVVDEYASFLCQTVRKLDPGAEFSEHEPQVFVTSDIDNFEKFPKGGTLKRFGGHLLKRMNPFIFVKELFELAGKAVFGMKDPFNTFERIFSIAEKFGTKPLFFILTTDDGPYSEGWFAKTDKDKDEFRKLIDKGAQTGLHYGYFSLLNENNIKGEKFELDKKYSVNSQKGRAHFLQFDVMNSYDILKKSGIKEDWTLGYSKYPGFRCGTGRAFRPWDFNKRQPHEFIERPLILMDTTLTVHRRMKIDAIAKEVSYYINISKQFRTDITFLIHNSSPSYVFKAFEDSAEEFLSGKI